MNTIDQQNNLKMMLDNVSNLPAVVDSSTELPGHKYDAKTYVMRSLKLNRTEAEIKDNVKSMYGISDKEACNLIKTAKANLKKLYKEYRDSVAEKNILTLQQIADDALEEGQKRIAIEAIKELNKMCGIGLPSTLVQNNTQINLNDIEITFK